jgi:transcriptional regulator with PAS, ATPase and Fis domain
MFVGNSGAIQKVRRLVRQYAPMRWTVLISGETGTGKELVARAIHQLSSRSRMPMVTVNCAAIPESLMENEFFGHRKGAFTGADRDQSGVFDAAEGGTLFLDEVGELPLAMQAKLLRVLEYSTYRPLGGTTDVKTDARIVAATNRNLWQLVQEGSFRADLYYRLDVLEIHTPPLRERPQDIITLANHFLTKHSPGSMLTIEAEAELLVFRWEGNARELEHAIIRSVLSWGGLIEHIEVPSRTGRSRDESSNREGPKRQLQAKVLTFERQALCEALERHRGNRSAAARELGITYRGLIKKMRRLSIE